MNEKPDINYLPLMRIQKFYSHEVYVDVIAISVDRPSLKNTEKNTSMIQQLNKTKPYD